LNIVSIIRADSLALGARADHPDYGIRSAHLRDPDGNLIKIYTQLPKPRWSKELREEDKLLTKK